MKEEGKEIEKRVLSAVREFLQQSSPIKTYVSFFRIRTIAIDNNYIIKKEGLYSGFEHIQMM